MRSRATATSTAAVTRSGRRSRARPSGDATRPLQRVVVAEGDLHPGMLARPTAVFRDDAERRRAAIVDLDLVAEDHGIGIAGVVAEPREVERRPDHVAVDVRDRNDLLSRDIAHPEHALVAQRVPLAAWRPRLGNPRTLQRVAVPAVGVAASAEA